MAVKHFERLRTERELDAMSTKALKEMASMLDLKDQLEHETLNLAIATLERRGVNTTSLTLGVEDIYAESEDGQTGSKVSAHPESRRALQRAGKRVSA